MFDSSVILCDSDRMRKLLFSLRLELDYKLSIEDIDRSVRKLIVQM